MVTLYTDFCKISSKETYVSPPLAPSKEIHTTITDLRIIWKTYGPLCHEGFIRKANFKDEFE